MMDLVKDTTLLTLVWIPKKLLTPAVAVAVVDPSATMTGSADVLVVVAVEYNNEDDDEYFLEK